MQTPYIQRMVNLEPLDYRIVRRLAERKGLGKRGFSAALRLIVREWDYLTRDRADSTADSASDSLRRGDGTSPIIRDWSRMNAGNGDAVALQRTTDPPDADTIITDLRDHIA